MAEKAFWLFRKAGSLKPTLLRCLLHDFVQITRIRRAHLHLWPTELVSRPLAAVRNGKGLVCLRP
jgi:hypothetical protein